jgi:hypothetical protein
MQAKGLVGNSMDKKKPGRQLVQLKVDAIRRSRESGNPC